MNIVVRKKSVNSNTSVAKNIRNNIILHINQFRKAFSSLSFEEKEEVCKTLKKTGISINLYENPTPVAVAIVKIMTDNGIKFLSVVRGTSPYVGEYCLPGGYIDKMENAQMAAARELFEETGLDLPVSGFSIIDSKVSHRNTILIFCEYEHVIHESEINWDFVNDETLQLSIGDRNTDYCFRTHQEIIEDYELE